MTHLSEWMIEKSINITRGDVYYRAADPDTDFIIGLNKIILALVDLKESIDKVAKQHIPQDTANASLKKRIEQLENDLKYNYVRKSFDVFHPSFNRNMLKKVDELELSVRSANCLKNENIYYIGDLVQLSESKMLRIPNFGGKSLNEIKIALAPLGLNFDMSLPNWPKSTEEIEESIKSLERAEIETMIKSLEKQEEAEAEIKQ